MGMELGMESKKINKNETNKINEINEYLHKFPIIVSLIMTIIIGLISYTSSSDMNQTYVRMAVSLIGFYIIGVFLKNILKGINEEIIEKKRKEEEEKAKEQQDVSSKIEDKIEDKIEHKSKIDYKIDDFNEEFSPLKVSEVIKTSLNDKGKKDT